MSGAHWHHTGDRRCRIGHAGASRRLPASAVSASRWWTDFGKFLGLVGRHGSGFRAPSVAATGRFRWREGRSAGAGSWRSAGVLGCRRRGHGHRRHVVGQGWRSTTRSCLVFRRRPLSSKMRHQPVAFAARSLCARRLHSRAPQQSGPTGEARLGLRLIATAEHAAVAPVITGAPLALRVSTGNKRLSAAVRCRAFEVAVTDGAYPHRRGHRTFFVTPTALPRPVQGACPVLGSRRFLVG